MQLIGNNPLRRAPRRPSGATENPGDISCVSLRSWAAIILGA
jgi:hypothetical protein